MKKFVLTLFIILYGYSQAIAQRFPITIIPQVNSPAPVNFYNYADATTINSPLRVQLLLNDLTITNEQIRLKVYFKGNGIAFESKDVVAGASSLFIDGGIPIILTNVELAPYFELQNILGINSNVYSETIPEGSFDFCFEVYDYSTGNRLSSKTCVSTYIFKNEPPILNLPLKRSNIEPSEIDNIVFQWTPRHINVSNVEYELSIVEIWDDFVDPQTAFLSLPPVFQTTTRATSFVYGPTQPLLLPEKRYAWRVKAKALQGAEEIGLFRNEGNSEIFWFSRTSPCSTPFNVYAEPKGISKINVFWDQDPSVYQEYTIAYREANKTDAYWFTKKTNSSWATIWDLKPGTTYEYKVKGKCKYQYGKYSDVQEITTATAQDETANYNCGIVPDAIAISNREPHPGLEVGSRITAGDFVVTIVEIESQSNGITTGRGYVGIPYLKNARFGVKFTNILVNTDNQLAQGEIITLYDPEFGEGETMTVDFNIDIVETIKGDQGETTQFEVGFEIEEIRIDQNGAVVMMGTNGEEATVPGGRDIQVVDSDGKVWNVDEQGNVKEVGEIAQEGASTGDNTDGIKDDDILMITATDALVTFKKSGYYYFDELPEATENFFDKKTLYPSIPIIGGGTYTPAFKAISNSNGDDIVTAHVDFKNDAITTDDIVFKTKNGVLIPAIWSGNVATLTLTKTFDYATTKILATVKPKAANEKHSIAGVLNVVHLGSKEFTDINIVLIPVNNSIISRSTEREIKEIYNKAGVNFSITVGERLQLSENTWDIEEPYNELNAGDSGAMSHYSKEELAINSYFKTLGSYRKDAYYVFVTDLKAVNSDTKEEIDGFMPLKRQFGYIFKKSEDDAKTIAHELGHGIFGLNHPFNKYGTPKGSTDFLMDYGHGTAVSHMDWKKIFASGFKLYWFQGDEEGQSAGDTKKAKNEEEKMLAVLRHSKINFKGGNDTLKWRELTAREIGNGNNYTTAYGLSKKEYKLKISEGNELKFKLVDQPNNSSNKIKISKIDNEFKIEKNEIVGIGVYNIYYELTLQGETEDAFVFRFDHYDDIEKFYNYLQDDISSNLFSKSEFSKSIITYLDNEVFPKKGIQTCNNIDLYFSEIPDDHIIKEIETPKLWTALKTLLSCSIDEKLIDEEKAVHTIIDALGEIDKNYFLSTIIDEKIEDKTIFQLLYDKLDSKNESKKFIEIVGEIASQLDTDYSKWEVINKIIKQTFNNTVDFHKFKEDKEAQKALSIIFSSLKSEYSKRSDVESISGLFAEMLISDCKHLEDYEIIYKITKDRYRNREAFATFTQSEKISFYNGLSQTIGAASWVLPHNFEFTNNFDKKYFAKDIFSWASKLSSTTGQYDRDNIKNTVLLKKPYQDFFKKFREEYKIHLEKEKQTNKSFWNSITVANVDERYQEIIDHINKNENAKSLRSYETAKTAKKIAVLKKIITKPVKDKPIYKDLQNDALLKIALSFRSNDSNVIEAIEEIGFHTIYKELSGDRLNKFLAWFGEYINNSEKINRLKKEDIEDILKEKDLSNSNHKYVVKLEQNIFQGKNDDIFVAKNNKNFVKINGKEIAYNQEVLVYIVDDFNFLNFKFKKGQVLSMPIIHALAISNNNSNIVAKESAWLVTDVVSFAIGVGAAKYTFTIGNGLSKALYTSSTIGSGISIITTALDESAIDAETRSKLAVLGFYLSIPGHLKDTADLYDVLMSTRKKVNDIPDLSQNSRNKINKYLDELSTKIKVKPATIVGKLRAKISNVEGIEDFKNWVKTIPEDSKLVEKLLDMDNVDIAALAKDFNFKSRNTRPDFIGKPNLLDAWKVLKIFPTKRAEIINLEVLAKISKRFKYQNKSGFEGLTKLISEGSDANKKNLVKGFKLADELFPENLSEKKFVITAIKKGDVKVIILEDGKKEKIARIVKGKLTGNKKYLTEGIVKSESPTANVKILQNGDDIGIELKDIKNVNLTEGDRIDELWINKIRKGVINKIAIVGRGIKAIDKKKGEVNKVTSKFQILDTEEVETFNETSQYLKTFTIDGTSYTWKELVDDYKNKKGIYATNDDGEIQTSELPKTLLYKANQQWCERMINEGYMILGIEPISGENTINPLYDFQFDHFFK
ncbi:fibronectin type III domain-containing protein [Aquimarina aquimarini]|uniref:fibronectin type III domain-containing protein n=1 Tax=Aquimarina aquimarini TaxID=1191734 RepID=UPI000D551A49|nr:fibronectin type III domain-containing protein [Aquimarina aquimarini]